MLLSCLLQQKWSVAIRTDFADGFIPIDGVTFWILGTAIKDLPAFGFFYDEFATTPWSRTRHARGLLLYVFTFGVIRTGDEFSEPPETSHQMRSIHRTFLIEWDGCGRGYPALCYLPNVATLRIARAAEKLSKASSFHLHWLAAELTDFRLRCFPTSGRGLRRG